MVAALGTGIGHLPLSYTLASASLFGLLVGSSQIPGKNGKEFTFLSSSLLAPFFPPPLSLLLNISFFKTSI